MEQMTQDEIDALVRDVSSGEMDIQAGLSGGVSLATREQCHAVAAALARYDHALRCGSFADARYARRYLHHAAHSLWLARHGFASREEFRRFVRGLGRS